MEAPVCHLIKNTPTKSDLIPTDVHFNVIKTFIDEGHLFRYLMKCRDCGQLFFFEFNEDIDWETGNDPQYTTYIPVKTVKEAEALNKKSPLELLGVSPRLQLDSGAGNTGEVRWIR